MDGDEKWKVIAEQRRVLADLLAELKEEDWERPSLCAQWRVKDVAAHVALTPRSPGVARLLVAGLRARGDFHALNRTTCCSTPWSTFRTSRYRSG
jgi:uncharacterized protein (TIGR03083 family)